MNRKLLQLISFKENRNFTSEIEGIGKYNNRQHYKRIYKSEKNNFKPEGWDQAKSFRNIPGPKTIPIIGDKWRYFLPKYGDYYKKDFLDIQRELHAKYGDIAKMKGTFHGTVVMLFNPTDFFPIFADDVIWPIRKNFPSLDYYKKMRAVINFGLVANHGEEWFAFRSAADPILMSKQISELYIDKINIVADELVDNIKDFARKNTDGEMPSDFLYELYKWSMESISLVTLDARLGCLEKNLPKDSEAFRMIYSVTEIAKLTYELDMVPRIVPRRFNKDWKIYVQLNDYLIKVITRHIDRALEKLEMDKNDIGKNPKSVLQQLLQNDRNIAIAMSLDMMLAGVDSTGIILGVTLYFLGKNPEKQKLLRNEIKSLQQNKDDPITVEMLEKAEYLDAVLSEALRLAPTAIATMRTAQKDFVLSGYQIPKGTDLMMANLLNCLKEEQFPKAMEYLPERWCSNAPPEMSFKNASLYTCMPFGYGARSCVGKIFAYLELKTALFKIVRNFDLSWPHKDMTFTTTILHGPAQPLKLLMKPID